MIHSEYLHTVFNPTDFQSLVNRTIDKAKEILININFDAIAFTGTSGSALAYILGYSLNIPLICVRKTTEKAHYRGNVEGYLDAKRILIIDDFIETGDTITNILDQLNKYQSGKCVAILCYNYGYAFSIHKLHEKHYLHNMYKSGIYTFSSKYDVFLSSYHSVDFLLNHYPTDEITTFTIGY